MKKKWLFAGMVVSGVAAIVVSRRFKSSGYDDDEIDMAMGGGEFGERGAAAPEQTMAAAHTRTDVTPEELSLAARIETSFEAIRTVYPTVTLDEVRDAGGDIDRLTQRIAEKSEQPKEQVRRRLDEIIARETPNASFPAH